MERTAFQRGPLDEGALRAAVADAASGAVVVFAGVSRNHHAGRAVVTLFYEAHEPLALAEMERLRAEAAQRFGARHVVVHHRLGEVPVGESSVIIAVSSDHRAQAFDAARWLMDQIKENVPIFKRETYTDGARTWTEEGLRRCDHHV